MLCNNPNYSFLCLFISILKIFLFHNTLFKLSIFLALHSFVVFVFYQLLFVDIK